MTADGQHTRLLPEEIPANRPSVAANSRPARIASSSGTPITSSTTETS